MMKRRATPLIFALLATAAASAQAAWPDRAITIVVPFSAGGNTDSIARIAAEWLTQTLHATVIVDNRPGANGAIAADYVARAANDGYTLFLATLPQMAIVPHLQKVRYDPLRSFTPVSIVATNPMALAVASNTKWNSLADVVKDAKAKPGQIAYASASKGSVSHLTTALFAQRAGISMNHIPYKGGNPAMSDLLGGQVAMYFGNVAEILPHRDSNKIKVIAVSGTRRIEQLPGVPTIAEQGYPGFETSTWNAIAAPAGTPPEIVNKLATSLESACTDAGFRGKLTAIGVDPLCSTPQAFAATLTRDLAKWGKAIEISGAAKD